MVSFYVYDLIFLVIFTLAVVMFLYKRRHNLKRQGILYLYRTKVGLKVIDWTAKKFGKILKPMQYVIITSGYILMAVMIWLLIRIGYIYNNPEIVRAIKIPPILPLFPYLPEVFKLDFLPPFYFTYWIIIIAVIAIGHEFAHGIFARLNKIKVHSTGFGFLGPFLAAFVEPDEKQMEKAKKFPQLSILAAGTFANVLMTILFLVILWGFFATSFAPAGINFNAYPEVIVALGAITSVNGEVVSDISNIPNFVSDEGFTKVVVENITFLVPTNNLLTSVENGQEHLRVFEDAPAINAGLSGPILEFDNQKITSFEQLGEEISKHEPGDTISIKSIEDDEVVYYDIELAEKDGEPYLGIGIRSRATRGILGWLFEIISKVKDPFVYYEPIWNGNFAWFVYNLLWWLVLINISVALVNMLPVGIFDGGRFFYLTVWGITGSEKFGRRAFSFATWAIILFLVWLMFRWAIAFV